MTRIEVMTAKTLAFCLREHAHPIIFSDGDRAELAEHTRIQLANMGVESQHMTYAQLLTTCELICGERTVRAA